MSAKTYATHHMWVITKANGQIVRGVLANSTHEAWDQAVRVYAEEYQDMLPGERAEYKATLRGAGWVAKAVTLQIKVGA